MLSITYYKTLTSLTIAGDHFPESTNSSNFVVMFKRKRCQQLASKITLHFQTKTMLHSCSVNHSSLLETKIMAMSHFTKYVQ